MTTTQKFPPQGGEQVVNLAFPSCIGAKGTIAHELMHALGFYHEHTRPDRNDYVIIDFDNIEQGKQRNFRRQTGPGANMYDHYDWNSVMHYDDYAFRNRMWNGELTKWMTRTIYPNPFSWDSIKAQTENYGRGAEVGQRIGLSFCDELKIRRHYAKPGLKGGRSCALWTPRTCRCKYIDKKDQGWKLMSSRQVKSIVIELTFLLNWFFALVQPIRSQYAC